ncbi:hypothetical protein KCV03_g154, partial [Aureobasidium melanogenum]
MAFFVSFHRTRLRWSLLRRKTSKIFFGDVVVGVGPLNELRSAGFFGTSVLVILHDRSFSSALGLCNLACGFQSTPVGLGGHLRNLLRRTTSFFFEYSVMTAGCCGNRPSGMSWRMSTLLAAVRVRGARGRSRS